MLVAALAAGRWDMSRRGADFVWGCWSPAAGRDNPVVPPSAAGPLDSLHYNQINQWLTLINTKNLAQSPTRGRTEM